MMTKGFSTTLVRAELAVAVALTQHWMQMVLVKYENGKRLQGVLLTLGGQWIRVAIQGADDAVEYRMVNGRWVSEDCEVVTFAFTESGFPAEEEGELPAIFTSEAPVPAVHRIM